MHEQDNTDLIDASFDEIDINQIIDITGLDKKQSTLLLIQSKGDVNHAIQLYFENNEFSVRQPIAPRRERLVEPLSNLHKRRRLHNTDRRWQQATRSVVVDKLRDFSTQIRKQEQLAEKHDKVVSSIGSLANEKVVSNFSTQSTNVNEYPKHFRNGLTSSISTVYSGTFQGARDFCSRHKRWMVVSIEKSRDILLAPDYGHLLSDSHLATCCTVWRVSASSEEGTHFTVLYPCLPPECCRVCVIDPITGCLVQAIPTCACSHADQFLSALSSFVHTHGISPSQSHRCSASDETSCSVGDSLLDRDEEEQMRIAINRSLVDCSQCSQSVELTGTVSRDAICHPADSVLSCARKLEDGQCGVSSESISGLLSCAQAATISCDQLATTETVSGGVCSTETVSGGVCSTETVSGGVCSTETVSGGVCSTETVPASGSTVDCVPLWTVVIRTPSGQRSVLQLSHTSELHSLQQHVSENLGYPPPKYEIVTRFPFRNLTSIDTRANAGSEFCSLQTIGLDSQTTVFIQEKIKES